MLLPECFFHKNKSLRMSNDLWKSPFLFFLLVCLLPYNRIVGQNAPPSLKPDSVSIIPDSLYKEKRKIHLDSIAADSVKIYEKIRKFALKNKITYLIYKSVFVEPENGTAAKDSTPVQKPKKIRKKDNLKQYRGKIIRNIEIITLDPFGTSINNLLNETSNKLEQLGNRLHINTRKIAIYNQLLFRKNEELDPLSLKESERLIRQLVYVRDARIAVAPVKNRDSVDVYVITQDLWSITGSAAISKSSATVKGRDNNFLGTGQQLENTVHYNFNSRPRLEVTGSYSVPNIRHSFFSSKVYYRFSEESSYQGISVDRQFYSTITKYAGGLTLLNSTSKGNFVSTSGDTIQSTLAYKLTDAWWGRSFQLTRGKSDLDRIIRLVVTGRVYNTLYYKHPEEEYDPQGIYQPSTLYLTSIGYSTRNYYKDYNIFRFGYTEDVPEGRLYALVTGYENRIKNPRSYSGIIISGGSHLERSGYLSGSVEFGSFFRQLKAEKGAIRGDISYFTDLHQFGHWSTRLFTSFAMVHGFKRDPSELLTLNDDLYGLKTNTTGTTKLLLKFQNVVYTPIRFLGFQFAIIAFAGYGMLASQEAFLRNKIYNSYGIGLLIRNEQLVVSTFQLSLGFYPNLDEGIGYKFNPVSSYNPTFKSYFLSKPGLVSY